MKGWFETEKLTEQLFRISEPLHFEETNCWLICGEERALLFDSGLGVGDIASVVRGLTDKPVSVLASHIHWDHIGGHGSFGEFYVHEAERQWIEECFPISRESVLAELGKGTLPTDFDEKNYNIFRGTPAAILKDGDTIDLGGICLEVIHTPGHSPGHICLWEAEKHWLFTGDTVYKGLIYADFPSTDPQVLLHSVEKLSALSVKRIFPGHHDTDVSVDIMLRMKEELQKLESLGLMRHGTGEYHFEDWGIRL